jgi:hypothetical protein
MNNVKLESMSDSHCSLNVFKIYEVFSSNSITWRWLCENLGTGSQIKSLLLITSYDKRFNEHRLVRWPYRIRMSVRIFPIVSMNFLDSTNKITWNISNIKNMNLIALHVWQVIIKTWKHSKNSLERNSLFWNQSFGKRRRSSYYIV